jgi:hypothetical protein
MTQITRVDHTAALAALSEAEEHFHTAHQINNSILDTNTQMTSGAWLGVAAQKHIQAHQQVHEEVHGHCNSGLQYCEIARNNINQQASLDGN